MGTHQVFKFAYEIWLFAIVLLLGAGPGTAWLRGWRLPAYYWLPLTLTSACLVSYGLFWIYFFDARTGHVAALVCWWASVAMLLWQLSRTRRSAAPVAAMLRDRDAWLPLLLMLTLTVAYLFLLFARDAPVNTRFTWHLPPDNIIPQLLALRIAPEAPASQPQSPFLVADWLSSDRPPLEAAIVLAVRPFAHRSYPDLSYQIIGTVCQMGWVVALYALARQLGLTRRQQAYAFLGCAFSGFFLLNSVYTWPKLLAAWLFVFAVTLLFRLTRHRSETSRVVPLAGVLLALSLLSHGGTAFSLLALPVLWLAWRLWTRVTWRQLAITAALFVSMLAPWIAYQRFYDPPGDRLLKEHLAGIEDIDPRSLRDAIVDQYARLTPGEYVAGRWANLRAQVLWYPRAPDETISDWLRRQQFFHHLAALDLLCIGFVGLWLRRPRQAAAADDDDDHDDARRVMRQLVLYALATIAVWCVLMYMPGAAIVHQGSYLATMVLFVAASVGLAELPRPIRVGAMGAHMLMFACVWLLTAQTSMSQGPMPWKPAQALGGALLLATFIALLSIRPARAATAWCVDRLSA
jgi:hypothetical protein